jgi:23S rRNA G2445 N2-methylase RlmL
MKVYLITNSGLEQIAAEEVKEKISVDSKVSSGVVQFSSGVDGVLKFVKSCQAGRRLLVAIDETDEVNSLKINMALSDYFSRGVKFKVAVEGVKGQDNRTLIAKTIAGKIFSKLEEESIEAELELKNPELLVVVYYNGTNYFLGIDIMGKELDSREYRVFTSSASFKGDFGYALVKNSNFSLEEKALFGFVKDGTMAIEAALWANNLPLLKKIKYSFKKMKIFDSVDSVLEQKSPISIYAVDSAIGNVNACRRNSSLAGVKELIKIQKATLEDWDSKYEEHEFNLLVIQVTSKDEEKLNEIYYQAKYLLKVGGRLMFVARPNWEPTISNKFKLLKEEELTRGESKYKYWLLERL